MSDEIINREDAEAFAAFMGPFINQATQLDKMVDPSQRGDAVNIADEAKRQIANMDKQLADKRAEQRMQEKERILQEREASLDARLNGLPDPHPQVTNPVVVQPPVVQPTLPQTIFYDVATMQVDERVRRIQHDHVPAAVPLPYVVPAPVQESAPDPQLSFDFNENEDILKDIYKETKDSRIILNKIHLTLQALLEVVEAHTAPTVNGLYVSVEDEVREKYNG